MNRRNALIDAAATAAIVFGMVVWPTEATAGLSEGVSEPPGGEDEQIASLCAGWVAWASGAEIAIDPTDRYALVTCLYGYGGGELVAQNIDAEWKALFHGGGAAAASDLEARGIPASAAAYLVSHLAPLPADALEIEDARATAATFARRSAALHAKVDVTSVSVVDPYAMAYVTIGEGGVTIVLQRSCGTWDVIGHGGGDAPPAILESNFGVPSNVAERLYRELNAKNPTRP